MLKMGTVIHSIVVVNQNSFFAEIPKPKQGPCRKLKRYFWQKQTVSAGIPYFGSVKRKVDFRPPA